MKVRFLSLSLLACLGTILPLKAQELVKTFDHTNQMIEPFGLPVLNGELYLFMKPKKSDPEIWKTDGTAAGTERIIVLERPENKPNASTPNPVLAKTRIFFQHDDGVNGPALWVTDGSKKGTRMVKDCNPSTTKGYPRFIQALGDSDNVIFHANDGNGIKIWFSDGTEAGTYPILPEQNGSLVKRFSDEKFAVKLRRDAEHGTEPWVIDGTPEGFHLLKDITPGDAKSNISYTVNGVDTEGFHYFTNVQQLEDNSIGIQLWKTDGTSEHTLFVHDLNKVIGKHRPKSYFIVGDLMYIFSYKDSDKQFHLWSLNLKTKQSNYLRQCRLDSDWAKAVGGRLLFKSFADETGFELYVSDGTPSGTKLLKDINPGKEHGMPSPHNAVIGDRLYFSSNDGEGAEAWVTDGTTEGTKKIADLSDAHLGSRPIRFLELNGKLLIMSKPFQGYTSLHSMDFPE